MTSLLNRPNGRAQLRQAVEHPGENIEWDFMVTSFKAMVDNAVKMLCIDADKRTPEQREIMTNDFLRNLGPGCNERQAAERRS